MAAVFFLICFALAELASARNFQIINRCRYTVYVGTLGNSGKPAPAGGGFQLNSNQQRSVSVADGWGGRFWGRTGCDANGHCETGDCGNRVQCNGAGGNPPATLAEITLNGAGGKDFYDVSLVDGFNLPVTMRPTRGGGNEYSCTTAGCNRDLNSGCPSNLQVRSGNRVVACKSSCVATHSDQDCCAGAYNDPNKCPASASARYFKPNCPGAYSYAYNDKASTFTCQGTDYIITFCG